MVYGILTRVVLASGVWRAADLYGHLKRKQGVYTNTDLRHSASARLATIAVLLFPFLVLIFELTHTISMPSFSGSTFMQADSKLKKISQIEQEAQDQAAAANTPTAGAKRTPTLVTEAAPPAQTLRTLFFSAIMAPNGDITFTPTSPAMPPVTQLTWDVTSGHCAILANGRITIFAILPSTSSNAQYMVKGDFVAIASVDLLLSGVTVGLWWDSCALYYCTSEEVKMVVVDGEDAYRRTESAKASTDSCSVDLALGSRADVIAVTVSASQLPVNITVDVCIPASG